MGYVGSFLDKFEGVVLDNARRVISSLILAAMLVGSLYLIIALWNFLDSPNVEITDRFDVPTFEKPRNVAPQATNKNPNESPSDSNVKSDKEPEWRHPMPEYEREFDDMIDHLSPLYIAFEGRKVNVSFRRLVTDYIADNIVEYQEFLSEDQFDDLVNGLEGYIDDFAGYYGDAAGLKGLDLDKIQPNSASDPVVETFLKNPTSLYLEGVEKAYEELEGETISSEVEASKNNASSASQIMITVGSIVAIILLVLLLIEKYNSGLYINCFKLPIIDVRGFLLIQ